MRAGKIKFNILLLSLVSPVWVLVESFRQPWVLRKWMLILVITIFGSTIILPEGTDASRHLQNVYSHYHYLAFSDFVNELWHIIILKPLSATSDIYIHVLSYFVGSVLSFPGLFFTAVAFVFGYFYINALYKILRWNNRIKKPVIFSAFVLFFIIYLSIDNMQTVRTWTGAWILFNGVFGYFQTKKKKYLLLMLCAPLVHAAYAAMALPAYFVALTPRLYPKIFIIVFFASFFTSIPIPFVSEQLKKSELGETKYKSYYRENPSEWNERYDETIWYVKHGKRGLSLWAISAVAFALIITRFYPKRMNYLEANLFSIGLLMVALANMANYIPSFYNRLMVNAGLYLLATLTLLLIRGELLNKRGFNLILRKSLLWVVIIMFLPKIVYFFANVIQFTSIYMIGVPFIAFFGENANISIREFLGWFIQ